jgi:dienelactone hydrolase
MHFDFEEGEKIWHVEDRQVKYNPEAATDAIARVKNFLSKNLK